MYGIGIFIATFAILGTKSLQPFNFYFVFKQYWIWFLLFSFLVHLVLSVDNVLLMLREQSGKCYCKVLLLLLLKKIQFVLFVTFCTFAPYLF